MNQDKSSPTRVPQSHDLHCLQSHYPTVTSLDERHHAAQRSHAPITINGSLFHARMTVRSPSCKVAVINHLVQLNIVFKVKGLDKAIVIG